MADTLQQLRDKAQALGREFEAAASSVADPGTLQAVRDRFVGRKSGAVSALMKALGGLAEAERREAGQELNALKGAIEARLDALAGSLDARRRDEALRRERLDTTLPGRRTYVGRRHPLIYPGNLDCCYLLANGWPVRTASTTSRIA